MTFYDTYCIIILVLEKYKKRKEVKDMRVRIYGKELNVWKREAENGRMVTTYEEVAYKEYDSETNELIGEGSEDFSMDRYLAEVESRWIYIWNGEKRNKGGYRWFDMKGYIIFRKSEKKLVKELIKARYPEAEVIQLR